MKQVKPSIILGLSGCGGLFQEELIREMSKNCDEPIIFPLSNPTSSAEAVMRRQLNGPTVAVFASGSPFDPVEYNGTTYVANCATTCTFSPVLGLAH